MELVPTFMELSPHVYLLVFALGGAVLALWLHTRFPDAGPAGPMTVMVHMFAAVLGARLIGPAALRGAGSDAEVLAMTIGVVLPLVVYMFMSAIWLIRFGQAMLGRYSR